ncbi:MAG: DUF4278 domain-containing protein [Synechococcus sp.]
MTTQERTYRGVSYDPNQHQDVSNAQVDHTYRGLHYSASLRHEAAPAASVELHYRGSTYHHRQHNCNEQVNS